MPAETRVLSVITRLARGGSERRLYDVLAAVPARHTVVVGRDSEPPEVAAMAERFEVRTCDSLVREVDPRGDARALVELWRTMRAGRFDVVHTHQAKAGLLGRVAARAARVPVVYHSASMAAFGPGYGRLESGLFALAERVTAPLVTQYFVVGRDLAARLERNGIASRRLEVVRSGIDLGPFTPCVDGERAALRAGHGIDPASAVVCFVGSLDERKGVGGLVDLVQRAAPGRRVALLVAGDGPLRADLEAQAARGADPIDLRLLGHVSDVAAVVRCADVLVLPSSAEGLPQVLVQAAASDVPFVAFDVDGVHELRAMGAHGRAVPLGDRAAFARALGDTLEGAGPARPASGVVPSDQWAAWEADVIAGQYRTRYQADLNRRSSRH